MTKEEKRIIVSLYKEKYRAHHVLQVDDYSATLRTLRDLMRSLGLTREMYEVDNDFIAQAKKLDSIQRQIYDMLFNIMCKYGVYTHYSVEEMQDYFLDLQYKMNKDERSVVQGQIRYLVERSA